MKRVLITGITGFVGSHLAEFLLSKEYEVYGIERPRSQNENISGIRDRLKLFEADIRDAASMRRLIKTIEPDYIFHLAAQSFVQLSFTAPEETIVTNITGNLNVLEAVRQLNLDPVIHVAGSSEEYGLVKEDEIPIKEENPLRPLSPYGVSKIAQENLSIQYHRSYGLKTVVTRAFNHTGPRRGEVFATSNFAKQIAEIEKGKKEPVIHVGNLEAKRDWTDVRDIIKAYLLAVEKCDYGEPYNICSGKAWKISEMLDTLLNLSGTKVETRQDPKRLRPSDVPILLGDYTKFKEKTGWQPEIPFETTLKDLLNYWRERVS